jgi:protein phosphatase
MSIAVSGDRGTCVSLALGRSTYLFAVADGFGSIDGIPAAKAALERLRFECERRSRSERFRRALERAESATTALLGIVASVNGELFVRSASHDDYVTAGCSLTTVLVRGRRAFVAHAGATAAYLARAGYVVSLTQDDSVGDAPVRILTRAVGTQPHLDASVCNFTLDDGDAMVLTDRRLRDADDRRRLASRLRHDAPSNGGDDHLLIVRYAGGDDVAEASPARSPLAGGLIARLCAVGFFILAIVCAR